MSAREVEQLDDRGIQAWDQHSPEAFVDLFADNFVWKDSTVPEAMRTKDEARQYMRAWFTAFPDMHVRRTNRVVSDDAVGAELEFTGTNTGPMMMGGQEVPPTGRSVTAHGTYFARVSNGKIVEFSSHPDVAEMMGQLGMMSG